VLLCVELLVTALIPPLLPFIIIIRTTSPTFLVMYEALTLLNIIDESAAKIYVAISSGIFLLPMHPKTPSTRPLTSVRVNKMGHLVERIAPSDRSFTG